MRVEIRERIIRDTATFVIEREVERNVTRDTISHLENRYAVSEASVTDGFLHHSLETKPQKVAVPVMVEVHDTTIVHHQAETIVKEVERALTGWQRFFITMGKIFFGILLSAIVALVVKFVIQFKKV